MDARVSNTDAGNLTLDEANAAIGLALAEARRLGVSVSIAVCGAQGRLVAFSKMDGAGCMTSRWAIGKAVASAISGELSEVMPPPGDDLYSSVVEGEGTAAFHERGGIPLRRNGTLIGAVGVIGDASHDQDLACATAGIEAFRHAASAVEGDLASFTERHVAANDAHRIGGHEAQLGVIGVEAMRPPDHHAARRMPLPTGA
jgi:glc operon protein GlcG